MLNFGKHPEVTKSKIAVEPNADLGKGGMIYEVAKGLEVGMTPGYEEGFNNKQEEGRSALLQKNNIIRVHLPYTLKYNNSGIGL